MSTIAIGDIHGNLAALEDLLGKLSSEVGPQDTVVFLGDYVDRGPDARGCIERILQFRKTAWAEVVALRGNHEDWLLRTYRDHTKHSWLLGMEAFETIRSYSVEAATALWEEASRAGIRLVTERIRLSYELFFDRVPAAHLDFLQSARMYWRTPDAVCVHGGLDTEVATLERQSSEDLLWGTDTFPGGYAGPDLVVYGHAGDPCLDGDGWPSPRVVGRTYGIDTICKGVLTALILPGRAILQSGRHL